MIQVGRVERLSGRPRPGHGQQVQEYQAIRPAAEGDKQRRLQRQAGAVFIEKAGDVRDQIHQNKNGPPERAIL
jgi:hypothetical protein